MAVFPSVDLTNFDVVAATKTMRDAGDQVAATAAVVARETAYTVVGLGLLTYQRLQVRRREIERELRD